MPYISLIPVQEIPYYRIKISPYYANSWDTRYDKVSLAIFKAIYVRHPGLFELKKEYSWSYFYWCFKLKK